MGEFNCFYFPRKKVDRENSGCKGATFGSVNKKTIEILFLPSKSCTFAPSKFWQCTGEMFPSFPIFVLHVAMSKGLVFGILNRYSFRGRGWGLPCLRSWVPFTVGLCGFDACD